MTNPNNCESCDHKKHPDHGWCYMFRLSPTGPCAHHTVRTLVVANIRQQVVQRIYRGASEKGETT